MASYDIFDLSGYWTINDTLSVRFGVDNVLDRGPAATAKTLGRPYDYTKTVAQNSAAMLGICNGAPGCQNPTSYSIGTSSQGTSSGGYYDVLGRRYFVGLKARF